MRCALLDFTVEIFYKIIMITEQPLKTHLRWKKKPVISLEVVSCCDKALVEIDTMHVACINRDSVDDEAPVMLHFLMKLTWISANKKLLKIKSRSGPFIHKSLK